MFSYDSFRQQQIFPQSYDSEVSAADSYPPTTMNNFEYLNNQMYNAFQYSVCDTSAPYAEAAPVDHKYEMLRSSSSSSTRHSVFDATSSMHSSASVGSTSSSTVGSPYSGFAHTVPNLDGYTVPVQSFITGPAIMCDDGYAHDFMTSHLHADLSFSEAAEIDLKPAGPFVDPVLITGARDSYYSGNDFGPLRSFSRSPQPAGTPAGSPSPVPSQHSYPVFSQSVSVSGYGNHTQTQREMSIPSQQSANSPRPSLSGDEGSSEKGQCPHPECGKVFKDLKAHMLTHQACRPEKCPIVNCEYHQKGFARKYDKNRHTLTHYKGTMVCGFCPGSGSPAEKSFNRADVFKRHLTSMHAVEQNPPNSRKRNPSASNKQLSSYCQDATGKCSTCSALFNNAQEFYEHLDDCVLRVVQQEEPSEAINAARLAEVAFDPAVQETFDRLMIKTEDDASLFNAEDEDDDEEEDDMDDDEDEDEHTMNANAGKNALRLGKAPSHRAVIGGGIMKSKSTSKRGMTWSKGGVTLAGKGRKRRKHYPSSWGMAAEKMRMKKRVLCVYDGSRRLLKDDMMLHNEFEVRVKLANGDNYVTDLDVETLKRAAGFHGATPEEKGPWIEEQDFLNDLME